MIKLNNKTGGDKMITMYEGGRYLMKETKQPKYLDFFDLEDKHLSVLAVYVDQTVRYKNKWFFITYKTKLFYSKKDRDNYAENWIKYLYKQPNQITKQEG